MLFFYVVSNFQVKISKLGVKSENQTETKKIVGSSGFHGARFFQLGGVRVPPSANGSSEHDCQRKINVRGLVEPWNAVYKRPNLLMQCNTVVVSLLISVCTQRDGAEQSVAEQCIVQQSSAQCSVQYSVPRSAVVMLSNTNHSPFITTLQYQEKCNTPREHK